MEKKKINLNILLPEIPDERDACVQRLIASVQAKKGISEVHVAGGGTSAQLCFHFDPNLISIDQVEAEAKQAGAVVSRRYGHLLLEVRAFRDAGEGDALENELRKTEGIVSVSVSASGHIRIEFDKDITGQSEIRKVLEQADIKIDSTKNLHKVHQAKKGHEGYDHGSADLDEVEDDDHEGHDHGGGEGGWKTYLPVSISLAMLLLGIALDNYIKPPFFAGWVRLVWYGVAYLPVGFPVARHGIRLLVKGDVFTEFVLMTIATIGAFFIGEYPEGVAVMVFYTVGELFQDAAVNRAKRSIKALLDIRPDSAEVQRNGSFSSVAPQEVEIGETIRIKAGDKVPLDGEVLTDGGGTFNTAALTGESKPSEIAKGESALAGMINQGKVIELKVTKAYNDSSLARILTLVQEATTRKAKTEQFIRKFSRIYTPIVVVLALCIVLAPAVFMGNYVFREWLYRALVFLVISCPCALVISIPLGYFGGIGAASRNGILFKGSNFLDLMTKVNAVVMDKTGTLTMGVFKVQQVKSFALDESEWLPLAAAIEGASTHPIAQAVVEYAKGKGKDLKVDNLEEISGHGLKASIGGREVLAGNVKLMDKMGIKVPPEASDAQDTIVLVGIDKKLAGFVTIADQVKPDSKEAIEALHKKGIQTIMLSGDKQSVVDKVAKEIGIDKAFGDLLPEDKVKRVAEVKKDKEKVVAFVGDGINDAPVLALSDVGMAMGGLGSDAAIETADVIIQTDQPSRIAHAIQIGKSTNRIVWQNIIFAFVVKAIVLALGAGGLATMWEAVFADVGVALLAVLNAMRIQRMKFD